jgi:putative ABC transport system permease protein
VNAAPRIVLAGLLRSPLRTVTRTLVLAAAVALLGSMLLFVGHSLRTMTGSAVRSVPLDWQGPVGGYSEARSVAAAVGRQKGVEQASAAATAPFASAKHAAAGATTSSGSGSVLAVAPGYEHSIHTYRLLQGEIRGGSVVLDQQMAATLQAHIGERISITPRAGVKAVSLPISGVALITAPDVVFQPLNPLLGPAPAQPPANAAIMTTETLAATIARELPPTPSGVATTVQPPGAAAVPGAQQAVQWQVQAQLDPGSLSGSPSHAFAVAGQIAHRVERSLPGRVQFVDNLSEKLNTAAGDALYAETLYIMLALPGAIVALGLAYLAALGTVERDRRDLALLRARGAPSRMLLAIALLESAAIGIPAGLLGTGGALAAVSLVVTGGVGLTPTKVLLTALACIALAFLGGLAARLAATHVAWRGSVSEGRRGVVRETRPLWQRLHLDVVALTLSGLIYWLTASTGFSAVVNPDSNPTLSLSVYMFFAPALLWIGATLLVLRLRGRALAWLSGRLAGKRAGNPREFLLASASRRGAAMNRSLLVIGLLLAFGVNLAIFTATYDQQASVDAQLTLGADITATAPPGVTVSHSLPSKIAAVPGVRGTSALDHSYAYVGPDLQDTFGIDAAAVGRATTLRDSYFIGASAAQTLARLAARPDGILVSKETITDYQLNIGDLLNLRVLDHRSGRFRVAPFHVAGIVQEFPSAPRDSFMVANLSYLQSIDRAGGPNVVFASASDPAGTARAVAGATRADGTIVKNISEQAQQTTSSITTVDLRGISHIEEAFTIALVAAAMALFLALAVLERRHEFATMAALGAGLQSIGAFLWSEAALVLLAALALAAVLGVLLAAMLVAMLQHVFDPPPDHLAIPWGYLGALAGVAVGTAVAISALAARRLRSLPLGELLREH